MIAGAAARAKPAAMRRVIIMSRSFVSVGF
jgi:hypothetical protein